MAVRDTEAFLRERAAAFDPNMDLSSGSPFDKQVIQPLIRRLGTDPFTVDVETYLTARLQQAFPELAVDGGDALTDLLIKPVQLLWDPLVREVSRVRKGLSFRDPNTLTNDEAEALGANLFAERPRGDFSRGMGRIFFAQAQNITVTPVNLVSSRSGLIFLPTETQSIRVEEMLLNESSDGTFYFDINVVAEKPGSQYDIGPNELASIANLESAVRVTNLRRFQFGEDEATAAEFVDLAKQDLTERSMVTLRGIASKVTRAFPEVSRLNSVGFNDPEMQRDIIMGGGLGSLLASGSAGQVLNDSVGAALSQRFYTTEVDFTALIGPIGTAPSGYVLTVFGATGVVPGMDLDIASVISANSVDTRSASLVVGVTGKSWSLRKRELTLSHIPGGILFPDGPTGEVTIPDGEVHIGGMVDIHVRGSGFDEATLFIDTLADDVPELSGLELTFQVDTSKATIDDLVLGFNYAIDDATYQILARAARDSLSLQVLEGVNAGLYRILDVVQTVGLSPEVTITPVFTSGVATEARWRIFDAIDVSLTDIKETRISDTDLITVQNSDVVTTASGTDFEELGVAEGDTLRILNGPDARDFRVTEAPLAPGFTQLRVDAKLTVSRANVSYEVFRANAQGNLVPPFIRISSIDLLDSSNQPLGTTIPYAKPVDIQSRAFQNPARGIKHRFTDVRLGLLSKSLTGLGFAVGGLTLTLETGLSPGTVNIVFSASPATKTAAQVADEISAAILAQTSPPEGAAAVVVGDRVGIRPFGPGGVVTVTGGSARTALFGGTEAYSTADIRSTEVQVGGGWGALSPALDVLTGLDVLQIIDGVQVGFVPGPYTVASPDILTAADLSSTFAPETQVTVEIGARSIGSARLFFLAPTSFEARANETFFEFVSEAGLVRYTPDPTLDHQRIPPLPNGTKPVDGVSTFGGTTFTSTGQDFLRSGIQAGDVLEIDYFPISGTIILADPVAAVVDTTLIFSIDGGADRTLIFIRDDVSLAVTEVSKQGVVDQINAAAGIAIARLTSDDRIEFEADADIVIRMNGTANPLILGNVFGTSPLVSFSTEDRRNQSPFAAAGPYTIESVDSPTQLTVTPPFSSTLIPPFTSPVSRQQFKVRRTGVQRISTGEMADNEAEAGLFYFDVELVSEGTGDFYNLDANQPLTASGYRSDGYYLTTEDSNLAFSLLERPRLVITKTILEAGVDDDPVNATQLAGQNLQITYQRASLVEDVNNFVTSEVERVINSNPLARHLIPHFVRFDVNYWGGSKEEVVVPELESYIEGLSPVEALESSDIQKVISDRGATRIENPLNLIAIVHNVDRTITATRSQDRLTTGRLAAFIPELLNVVRRVT